jgi:hypothetical protein
MASIKTRVACLEQVSKATIHRPMSDVELAVRVTTILNNPASSPLYGPLTEFMNRAVVNNARCQRDVPASAAFNAGGNRPQDLKSTTALIRT